MGLLTSIVGWGVRTGLDAVIGGGSGKGSSGVVSSQLAKASKETQQQLASISAQQTMTMYNQEKSKIKSAGDKASALTAWPSRHNKSKLGLQLIQRAKQSAVSDPVMMQLIEKQGVKQGVDDESIDSVKSTFASAKIDTGTRVRKITRGSFLDT